MTRVAGKAGSMRAVKTTSPIPAVGSADETAAARYISAAARSSHRHSAVAPSLPPQWTREQNRAQRRHEHPAPHAYIIAPNEGTKRWHLSKDRRITAYVPALGGTVCAVALVRSASFQLLLALRYGLEVCEELSPKVAEWSPSARGSSC